MPALLTWIRSACVMLLLAVMVWSVILGRSVLLTAGIAVCSHVGWKLGKWIHPRGYLACQIARMVLLALTVAGVVVLDLHPELDMAVLAQCGFSFGVLIALASPDGGGRRSRRTRRQWHLQHSFPVSHLPLHSASAIVRFL